MTQFSQLVTPRRMGRKPIKANLLMKQFTHWLDPNDIARVHAFVGKQKVSEYLRAAIAEKLERDRAPAYDAVAMRAAEKPDA